VGGATAAAVLVAMGLIGGFWWPDGLAATRGEYHDGVASLRPYSYFVVANVAVVAVAVGPALGAGLAAVGRRLLGPGILLAGALVTVAGADLSGLSKAEVERIWLPFVPWLATAAASTPGGRWWPRFLLAGQAATAVTIQVLLRTPW
jgi:methylthioxylose transferase